MPPIDKPHRASPVELLRATEGSTFFRRIYGDKAYTRVRAGVYTATKEWSELKPWDRYLARVHAYGLVRADAVFAFESAAVLCGLPIFGEPRDIHIFDARRTRSLRFGDVSVHTSADARAIDDGGLFQITNAASTVVDLARVLPPAFALALVEEALRREFVGSLDDLIGLAGSQRATRGQRRLAWIWSTVDVRSESVGESVSRAVMQWLGFPTPDLQRTFIAEGFEDRVDFFWDDPRVIGESDGYAKYASATSEEVMGKMLFEKKREDRLRRQGGGFARWDWADAMRAVPLREKLFAAGLALERPSDQVMLATLRDHPRSLPRAATRPTEKRSSRRD